MFDGIADGFLRNFIELQRRVSRQRWNLSKRAESGGNVERFASVCSELAEKFGKILAFRFKRTETMRQIVGMIDYLVNQRLNLSGFIRFRQTFVRQVRFERFE